MSYGLRTLALGNIGEASEAQMRRAICLTVALAAAVAASPAHLRATGDQRQSNSFDDDRWRDDRRDDHDDHRDHGGNARDDAQQVVTVAFGVGLNTGQLGEPNHHLLPEEIVVKKGGVVNFVVAGFHQIFVYNPGVRPRDVLENAPVFDPMNVGTLYINYGFPGDPMNPILYYAGINPGFTSPPPPAPPLPPPNPAGPPSLPFLSNAFNRVEPVAFLETGRYLVICNINPHFLDGMWAWVRVVK
jgi:hypothetical protein